MMRSIELLVEDSLDGFTQEEIGYVLKVTVGKLGVVGLQVAIMSLTDDERRGLREIIDRIDTKALIAKENR